MSEWPLITLITLVPLAGAMIVAAVSNRAAARGIAMLMSLVALGLAGTLWAGHDPAASGMGWEERGQWIPTLGVDYHVGVDGLGLLMVMLSALLVPFSILMSWRVEARPNIFFSLLLLVEVGLIGSFTALNFFHWFIFWELVLIPAYFLIKLWGGADRVRAATQFFVYTMVGSVTLLLGFLAVYGATGSFDFLELAELSARGGAGGLSGSLALSLGWLSLSSKALSGVIFFGIFLGFAVKVPLFPFHTWQAATYAEAPVGVTMLLTGALSKMGVYGFLRVLLPIFPDQMRAMLTPLLWMVVCTIVFSALAAFAQKDLKRIVAYSSMNHLGYCLLGIVAAVQLTPDNAQWATEKAAALNGVLLQMFNHGVIASAVFCFIGLIEQRSGGLRGLDDFGGLRRVAPVFCGLMGIALLALLGLPGLSGFIGEFLIFKGAFPLAKWASALGAIGILATAIFILTVIQRVFSGPLNEKWSGFADLTLRERLLVLPAVILMFVIGVYPQVLIGAFNQTVIGIVDRLQL